MSTLLRIALALFATGWSSAGFSQQTLALTSDLTAKVAQARQANATLMHQHTWNSRTEILSDGQVKDTRIELVNFGPTGQLQHTLLNGRPAFDNVSCDRTKTPERGTHQINSMFS